MALHSSLVQRHFANLRHVRNTFVLDPRAAPGAVQVAPFLSRVVQLVHPAFPGAFRFSDPQVRLVANPAVGAELSISLPADESWGFRAIEFVFTSSAIVANRQVSLVLDDGTNEFCRMMPTSVQAENLPVRYIYALGQGYEAEIGNAKSHGLPDVILRAGWRVRTATAALDVGDQFSAIVFLVDVFPT